MCWQSARRLASWPECVVLAARGGPAIRHLRTQPAAAIPVSRRAVCEPAGGSVQRANPSCLP
jgi:hypothetical protein